MWVDQSATSGCTDAASVGDYNAATDCTWDQAFDACDAGDTVIVRGDTYGDVTVSGHPSGRTGMCEVWAANGEAVVIDEFENGFQTNDTGGDWFTISAGGGTITAKSLYSDNANQTAFDGWTVDAEFSDPDSGAYSQIMHFEDTSNAVFRDGEIRNACSEENQGGMIVLSGDGPMTLENNEIHDAHMCDPSGDPHTECIWSSAANNVTLSGNIFHHCGVMSVFVTGWDGNTYNDGWVVENNVIGRPCSDNESPHVCESPSGNAFHFRSGAGTSGDPAPIPSGWVIRYNTFRGNLNVNTGGSPPVANVIKGNVFLSTATCSVPNATYSYNAHVSGSCGGTGTITNASLLTNSFVDPDDYAAGGGDWNLITGSPLIGAADDSDHPDTDRAGNPRDTDVDIGAYEYQG